MGSGGRNYQLYEFLNPEDISAIVKESELRNRMIIAMVKGLDYSDLTYNGKIAVIQDHFPSLSYNRVKNIIGGRPAETDPP